MYKAVVGSSQSASSKATANAEQCPECSAELSAHDAVEDEINGAVYDDNGVPYVAQGHVDPVEDAWVDSAEQCEDPLGQFCCDEEENNGQQHPRRPVVISVVGVAVRTLTDQASTPGLGGVHRAQQEGAERHQ